VTPGCLSPFAADTLLDYWAGDLDAPESDRVEEHLFTCGDCVRRLDSLASLGSALAEVARQGRIAGIISRTLLNRMQRDGVRVRYYSLSPGQTVPCAAFPGDDLVVVALRADLGGVRAVTLSAAGSGNLPVGRVDDAPVHGPDGEVLWATPGALVREIPSGRVRLTLASSGADGRVLGEYVLDHSASE
jgi:hypothetical protein